MTRYLVTGGAGFIGSTLVRRLLHEGGQVRVLDNFSTGSRANLEECADQIELIDGDITSLETVRDAVAGVDYVFHEAAIPSVPRSIVDPLASHLANTDGTLHVLLAARDAQVKRVIFAGSSSVYGDTEVLPKVETMRENPLSPYALTKLTGEKYCRIFYRAYGLETVCLRYFNVFGPRQDPSSPYSGVISRFLECLLDGRQPTVFGDGEQSRDFTYIDNVVEANLLASRVPAAAGDVFNIGVGGRVTLNQVLQGMGAILGRPAVATYSGSRAGDVKHSQADISAARNVLGYSPAVTWEEGLRRTVAWFQQQHAFVS